MKPSLFTPLVPIGLLSLLAPLAVGSAWAQGNIVNFTNLDPAHGVNAPFFDATGTNRLAGENYVAALYFGPPGSSADHFQRVGSPKPFRTGNLAGYWVPASILIPSPAPGGTILAQVRFWDTQGGTLATFEQALAAGAPVGLSLVLPLALSPSGSTSLTGLRSASLIPAGALSISAIENRSITENTSTGPIPFTVAGAGIDASTLLVTGTSSNPSLVPAAHLVFGGSGNNRSVTVMPAPNQFGSTTITVVAGLPSGGTASRSFTVTVNALLSIARAEDGVTVSWTAVNGRLQHCHELNTLWEDILPEPTSPYRVPPAGSKYYRLRQR